jgi:hypothetical protein
LGTKGSPLMMRQPTKASSFGHRSKSVSWPQSPKPELPHNGLICTLSWKALHRRSTQTSKEKA